MTEELPSDWHLAEALRRENPDWDAVGITRRVAIVKRHPVSCNETIAHARTLAEFMKEPDDPLLVLAREICAKVAKEQGRTEVFCNRYRDGEFDNDPEVKFTLECLRKAAGGVE